MFRVFLDFLLSSSLHNRHRWCFHVITILSVVASVSVSLHAGTFTANFSSDPGGTPIGAAVIEDGILKLVDLNDLNDGTGNLPRHGSYILPDFNNGAIIGSFNAKFKARVGGGTERAAQGFCLVLANDLAADVPFREAGGTADGGGFTAGLVVSFDTIDNLGVFGANGNDPGDAPGVIVRIGGAKVAAKRATNLTTDPPAANNIGTSRFVDVEVNLDPDGTLDVTYDGVKIYDNAGIGYTPIAGVFGFGAGTAELTAALRNNHWIDDVNITATAVSGSYISSKAPAAQNARADSAVAITVANLSSQSVQLTLNGTAVTPTVNQQGATTTITYRPPQLFPSESKQTVALTYDGKSFSYDFTIGAYKTISGAAKAPAGSVNTSSSGFNVRTYQVVAPPPSGVSTAERQLAGLSGANIANLTGVGADGRFNLDLVNYSEDGSAAGNISAPAETLIPGIPGMTPEGNEAFDNYVVESIAYLDLPQGYVVLGVASLDGFQVSLAQDPRDATATIVGLVNGGANTTFSFLVEEAGIYGVRVLHYGIGGAGHCEFFSLTGDGSRVLINDRATTGHIKAYRDRSATFRAAPYVTSAKPAPGESNVSTRPSVEAVI
ncbi:MAG: hypothetical protein L0Z50_16765, partial [Verrucomicrobiales bacterium]|nr:hypothetical protein [Verrucomicrobiales bacterium]